MTISLAHRLIVIGRPRQPRFRKVAPRLCGSAALRESFGSRSEFRQVEPGADGAFERTREESDVAQLVFALEAARLASAQNVQRGGIADHEAEHGDAFAVGAALPEQQRTAAREHRFLSVAAEHAIVESGSHHAYAGRASG